MIDPATVITAAAALFAVPVADLRSGRGRRARITQARIAITAILRDHGYTVVEIGLLLGRDHTTVCYYTERCGRLARDDPAFAARLRALQAAVGHTPAPPAAPTRQPLAITPQLRLSLSLWGVATPQAA